jgi:cellulose biosynthesis protein BcsQ
MQALLRDRIVFRKAVRNGLSVLEYQERDHAAGTEVSDLYREVYGDA